MHGKNCTLFCNERTLAGALFDLDLHHQGLGNLQRRVLTFLLFFGKSPPRLSGGANQRLRCGWLMNINQCALHDFCYMTLHVCVGIRFYRTITFRSVGFETLHGGNTMFAVTPQTFLCIISKSRYCIAMMQFEMRSWRYAPDVPGPNFMKPVLAQQFA